MSYLVSIVTKRVWPFSEPTNLGVITTRPVLESKAPILLVTHDEDDGGWQFLCGTTEDPDDGVIVHLEHMLDSDPSLAEIADLPLGWVAYRASRSDGWTREPA